MRFKKFFAGMTVAALAASMLTVLPASAKTAADMPANGPVLKDDGSPVIAKAVFSSGDGSVNDTETSIEVIRGENTLRITPKNADGAETKGVGASKFCIDLEGVYEQYPNMMINVSKVSLVKKQYDENGNPIMKTETDKETGEKHEVQKTKSVLLKAPNLEKPEKDADTTLDYAKIQKGDFENNGSWRVEFYNADGATKDADPFKGRDVMEYDYIDVVFTVWENTKLEKQVFDNYVINADDPSFEGYFEDPSSPDSKGRAYRNFIYLCGEFEETDKTSKFVNSWDLSTVTAITYFVKGNEKLLASRDWSGFGIGIAATCNNWYQVESTNQVYVMNEDGTYKDADNDGYADLVKPASLVKIEDGLYAVTIVKKAGDYGKNDEQKGFFNEFDTGARIWLNDWNNDESGEAVFQLDHVVLNPSPENVYINDKVNISTGEAEKQTYEKPTWEEFNEGIEPDDPKPGDDNPTDSETSDGETSDGETTDKEDGLLGDVNGDGEINVQDISKAAAAVKGIKPLEDAEAKRADVNGDGEVKVNDVVQIAAHVKGVKAIEKK